jgi:hypothetical protein
MKPEKIMGLIKKENICISEEYTDRSGNQKKLWKTIGEIVTFEGDNGQYQKIKLWGAGGFVDASVFDQEKKQAVHNQGYQQARQALAPPVMKGEDIPW